MDPPLPAPALDNSPEDSRSNHPLEALTGKKENFNIFPVLGLSR